MVRGDVVVLPQLRCEVALEAQRLRHDIVKNRLLLYADDLLLRWLRDEANVRDLEVKVRRLCRSMQAFSASALLPQLRPLGALSPEERQRIATVLDRAFEEGFRPHEPARRLGEKLDALVGAARRLVAVKSGEPDEAERIRVVRAGARELAMELSGLPEGFWLPHATAAQWREP